jgi:hypothetical protein
MTQSDPMLISVSEAANLIGVTPGRVRQFIAEGRLPVQVTRWRQTPRGRRPHVYGILEADAHALAVSPRHTGGSRAEVPFDLFVPYLRRRLRAHPTMSIRELHEACTVGITVRRRGSKEPEVVKYPRGYSWFREEVARRDLRPEGYVWRGGWRRTNAA